MGRARPLIRLDTPWWHRIWKLAEARCANHTCDVHWTRISSDAQVGQCQCCRRVVGVVTGPTRMGWIDSLQHTDGRASDDFPGCLE